MTGDNRQKNIAIEVARGKEALREAESLLQASMPTGRQPGLLRCVPFRARREVEAARVFITAARNLIASDRSAAG